MHKTAQAIYSSLEGHRHQYLDRARTSASLTIPYIMPEAGFGPHSKILTPFQGVGAQGVNLLSSKLLLALLPPNSPFFRLNVDAYGLMEEGTSPEIISGIEQSLQQVEEAVMDEISRETYRTAIHSALKHLIITGNALLYLPDEGGIRVFHLDRYVIERDPMGNVIKIATKENIAFEALDDEMRDALIATGVKKGDDVHLFTSCCTMGDEVVIQQDVNGTPLVGRGGVYPKEKSPYIPLRFSRVDGESYGRGYVEEYLGDLQSLEGLTRAIVEGSAASAKLLFMVNPNGTTRARTLAESPNGAIVQGNAQDVSVVQTNKFADFRVAQETIAAIRDRLGAAFLLTQAVVRNAERVTAEEIRMLSQQLEAALGGLYSLLSTELQMPLVTRLMEVMNRKKKLPKLPKDVINPVIITGVEALGRGNDLQKLDLFLAGASQVIGPQAVAQYVNVGEYFKRRATSLGIKTIGLVKTPEELQAEMQQQQQMELLRQATPTGVKAIADQIQSNQDQEVS